MNDDQINQKLNSKFMDEPTTKRDPKYETFSEELVHKILEPEQDPAAQFRNKLERKVLLLDDKIPDYKGIAKELEQKRKKEKRKTLNRNERKALGLLKIPVSDQKYSIFEPLHGLWKQYMNELFGPQFVENEGNFVKLARADLHGAVLEVAKSKCPSNIGIAGIVVNDGRNTFELITKHDKLKTIPKAGNVFRVSVCGTSILIFGNNFRVRAADRITKKFKGNPLVCL